MSLLKTKYNRSKARRIKLSNRNKIEHLHSQLKKFKAEKREMKAVKDKMKAEKDELVQQQLQDIRILTEELKSEKKKVHDHFSSGHVCFDILNCDPKRLTDLWSIPKMTALLLDRKVSLPALTSTSISVMVSTKTNLPLFYQHSHIACEFSFLKCNKFSSPFNREMRWFQFITWIYCKCP